MRVRGLVCVPVFGISTPPVPSTVGRTRSGGFGSPPNYNPNNAACLGLFFFLYSNEILRLCWPVWEYLKRKPARQGRSVIEVYRCLNQASDLSCFTFDLSFFFAILCTFWLLVIISIPCCMTMDPEWWFVTVMKEWVGISVHRGWMWFLTPNIIFFSSHLALGPSHCY